MKFDLSDLNQSFLNSASSLAEFDRVQKRVSSAIEQENKERIKREEKMVAGAEASIAHKELLVQQVEILQKQNNLLSENYAKLKEMYDAQVEANKEAKKDLQESRRYNTKMMVIAIIAMLAAIAGPIATILVSK